VVSEASDATPSDIRQPAQRRRLGRHGPELTRIGFGAWAAGGDEWGPQDDARSIAAIHHASTSGINRIETAPTYGLGHSEEVVGTALAGLDPQDRPQVFTKCSRVWDARGRVTGCLRPASIRRECESSLRRLRLEAIDLYLVHQPDPEAVYDPSNVLRRNQNIPPPATLGHTAAATRLGRKA
jgi:aryl-alcohol dehydrogenase-like predicted oxidoreductase